MKEMNTEILKEIGLSDREIRIYLTLLKTGPSTAGQILEKANIQNSVFHFCIKRLIEKGLTSYTNQGNARVYKAADPSNFLLYLKDKEKKVKDILPQLKAIQVKSKSKQQVELFEGFKGLSSAMNELIRKSRPKEEFLFFTIFIKEKNEEIQKFYKRYDSKRKSKGLITKGIGPLEVKPFLKDRKYIKMKFTSSPVPGHIAICNNKMVIFTWEEKPRGVLIHSKEIVKKQEEFFHSFWKTL